MVFFTFFSFMWLFLCGVWAFYQFVGDASLAWLGLTVNSLALPFWVAYRHFKAEKINADLRETPAFFLVLTGLLITLLTDQEKGVPLYFSLYNLFIVLLYLFQFSRLRFPRDYKTMLEFPPATRGSSDESEEKASLWVFLRSPWCAHSRAVVTCLEQNAGKFAEAGVRITLWLAKGNRISGNKPLAENIEIKTWAGGEVGVEMDGGQPLLARISGQGSDALKPSYWLLDSCGRILWRHLPANYRTPGDPLQALGFVGRAG